MWVISSRCITLQSGTERVIILSLWIDLAFCETSMKFCYACLENIGGHIVASFSHYGLPKIQKDGSHMHPAAVNFISFASYKLSNIIIYMCKGILQGGVNTTKNYDITPGSSLY